VSRRKRRLCTKTVQLLKGKRAYFYNRPTNGNQRCG